MIYKAALYYTPTRKGRKSGERIMIQKPSIKAAKPEYLTVDHSDLPILGTDDVITSVSKTNKEFLLTFMHPENLGRYHYLEQLGVTIQNVGGKVVRCITVGSHEGFLLGLAMLNCTVKAAGGLLQLAPYTVVVPYLSLVQEESQQFDKLLDDSDIESMEVA